MASLYQYRVKTLMGWGFSNFEAKEFAKNYTIGQMRSVSYLQKIVKARRLFVINQRNKLVPENKIRERIKANYIKSNHVTDGKPDVWKYLRDIRKKDIESGEYHPIKRKGSHHKVKGISKGDLQGQRIRRKGKQKDIEREKIRQDIIRAQDQD